MLKPEKDLIAPLDYLILGDLPLEGTLVFDLYPDGHTSKHLAEVVLKGQLNAAQVGRRLGSLCKFGLAVSVNAPGHHAGKLFQATPAGKKIAREWKDSRGGQ